MSRVTDKAGFVVKNFRSTGIIDESSSANAVYISTGGNVTVTGDLTVTGNLSGSASGGSFATWSALTGTNTAIRSLVSSNDTQIGNLWTSVTNANTRINLVNTNLTGTNTAIRTLVSDRIQVANADSKYATWSALTSSNTSIRGYVDTEIAGLVASAPSTLDTLNELAAALGDDPNFATTLTTNLGQKLGATASITLTGDVTGSGSFSSNSVSIALTDTNLGNTNAWLANTASEIDLLNTNLTGTNTAIRSLISSNDTDISNLQTEDGNLWSAITATNTAIRTLVSDRMQVANTTTLVNDRLQVANAVSTYQTIAIERAALANTNTYIATKIGSVNDDTSPQLGGNLDTNGFNINFGDSATPGTDDTLTFGASNDLQIYHNATVGHSYIVENGTGDLRIYADSQIRLGSWQTGDLYFDGNAGGDANLYYSGSKKLATTSAGIDITGNITVSGTVDGVDVATLETTVDGKASIDDSTALAIALG